MRINRYIAQSGITSRRKADDLIKSGKVFVNGKCLNDLSYIVQKNDIVLVNSKRVKLCKTFSYVVLNKPKGCVTTVSDEKNRKIVYDYLNGNKNRLFPVGRLDFDTEGLLLLTNDGDLAHVLAHPSYGVKKRYEITVKGEFEEEDLCKLSSNLVLEDGPVEVFDVEILSVSEEKSKIALSIIEGRNRIVRRIFELLEKEILYLKRTELGPIRLGGMSRGQMRYLTQKEINLLKSIDLKHKRKNKE